MKTKLSIFFLLLEWRATSADLISVDTSLAYTWDSGYPQACDCIETGVTNSDCSIFKCACTCDLTAGSCDYNCCCDPDCSQAQIDHFENDNRVCYFSGSAPESEKLCYSANELQKVNPRNPVGGSSTTASAVDELLCVSKVNREYKGDFYESPAWRGSSVFQASEGQKNFDYSNEVLTVDSDTAYDQNDTIPIFHNSTDDVILSDGFFTLPIADFSGYCNDNNFAKFQIPIIDQVCRRRLDGEKGTAAFASRCALDVSTLTYTSLLIAATPTDNLLGLTTVPISVSSVTYSDGTSTPQDITAAWLANGCSTSYGNNQSHDLNCQFSNEDIDVTDFICFNAVKSVSFTIVHDQSISSEITNVSLQLVVTDIPFSAAAFDLTQAYSVTYSNAADQAVISSDNGNQVPRYRSGNPGYKIGLPLLFGPIMNKIVNMSDEGLLVPSLMFSPASSEQNSDNCFSEQTQMSALIFGQDIFSGCAASFNRSTLRSFCMANVKPSFLTTTEGFIGYFGNADPLDPSQWFHLSTPPTGAVWQWNDATSTCSSMITGVNYKFLVGYTGEKSNPQSKIISATVDYTSEDVRTRIPAGDEVRKHTVVFSVSATFVFKDEQKLKGYTPPPPPGLLTVPYDVFYPFIGNSAFAGQQGLITVTHVAIGISVFCFTYFIF